MIDPKTFLAVFFPLVTDWKLRCSVSFFKRNYFLGTPTLFIFIFKTTVFSVELQSSDSYQWLNTFKNSFFRFSFDLQSIFKLFLLCHVFKNSRFFSDALNKTRLIYSYCFGTQFVYWRFLRKNTLILSYWPVSSYFICVSYIFRFFGLIRKNEGCSC